MKQLKVLDIVTMMTYLEGGKSQIKRSDMIQAIGLLGMAMVKDGRVTEALLANGRKRWAKVKK